MSHQTPPSTVTTIALPPNASRITYTSPTTHQPKQQPHTTPIAHFASLPNIHPTANLIAISPRFIVYVVKNGLIRVIDRRKALRTLLRGHSARVCDLKFFSSDPKSGGVDVLGSVGGEGDTANVLIWRLFPKQGGVGQPEEIGSEKLLEVRYKQAVRIVWHPIHPNEFVLLHRPHPDANGGGGMLVETTKLMTAKHATENHVVCELSQNDPGGTLLWYDGFGSIGCLDMDWSCIDTRLMLLCGGGHDIVLMDGQTGQIVSILNIQKNDEDIIDNVDSVKFVHRTDGILGHFDAQKKALTEPFITGIKGNSEITLWSSFISPSDNTNADTPMRMRTLNMGYTPIQFHLSLCSSPGSSLVESLPKACIVLADRNSGDLYSVNIGMERRDEFTLVKGLDSISPFQIMHPVLSWMVMGDLVQDDDQEEEGDDSEDSKYEVSLFVVQGKAVQLLKLKPKMLRRPKLVLENGDGLDLPSNVFVDYDNAADITEENIEEDVDADAAHYEYEEDDDEVFEDAGIPNGNEDEYDEDYDEDKNYNSSIPKPPPGLTNPDPSSQNEPNSFSNWLGAIASGSLPTPEVLPSPPTLQPNVQSMPAPVAPSMIPPPPSSQQSFLSPAEILSSNSAQIKQEKTTMSTLKPSSSKPSTTRKKSPKQPDSRSKKLSSPPSPKIQILKREQPLSTDSSVKAPILPPNTVSTNGTLMEEALLKNTLQMQFKRHEATMLSEFQKSLRMETKNTLTPALTKHLSQTIEQSISKPLQSHVSKGVKDREKKMVKDIVDGVEKSVKEVTTRVFQENMRKVFVPAFEAATQEMFSQISSSLSKGQDTAKEDNAKLIMGLSDQISSLSDQLDRVNIDLQSVRGILMLRETEAESEVDIGYPPPASAEELLKEEILSLLSETNYSLAFAKALSVRDPKIAFYVCEHAKLSSILDDDNDITQPILLCLMQQLSAGMSMNGNEMDLRMMAEWLQDIAVSIDPRDPAIKNHIGEMMTDNLENISSCIPRIEDGKIKRKVQMVLQIIRGLDFH